jgi:hypothetical protein
MTNEPHEASVVMACLQRIKRTKCFVGDTHTPEFKEAVNILLMVIAVRDGSESPKGIDAEETLALACEMFSVLSYIKGTEIRDYVRVLMELIEHLHIEGNFFGDLPDLEDK